MATKSWSVILKRNPRPSPRIFSIGWLVVTILILCVGDLGAQSTSYYLDANPQYSFGSSPPGTSNMAYAISSTMGGVSITSVGFLPNENTAYPPVLGDSSQPPYYIYGPGPSDTVQNLNLNQNLITGVTSGEIRYAGQETDPCGFSDSKWVLRVFTSTQFSDILIRYIECESGGGVTTVVWSFDQVSALRTTPPGVTLTSAVSRKTHGSAGTFDVNLPTSGPAGIECRRTTGLSTLYQLIFTFSNTLTHVDGASVTRGVGTVHDSSIGSDAHQYIVNLTGVSDAQTITVTLTQVVDSAGNNSLTVNVPMGVLIGDVNASGAVNSTDVSQVQGEVGQPVNASTFRNDVNLDGVIDSNDVTIVTNKKGTHL